MNTFEMKTVVHFGEDSLDRLKIDREVISSYYEEKLLTGTYGFNRENLICSGMPRYDYIDERQKPKKKILYAPTWRRYLINRQEDDWVCDEDRFVSSHFYKSVMNHYYRLDLPIEDGFGPFVQTVDDAVNRLIEILDGQENPCYTEKMEKFFMYKDNRQRDRVYEALKGMR